MKVLSIFGTRPEAIKMAPVLRELTCHPDHVVSRVCVTAQHREMLDQVLALFGITPDYDLDLMHPDQSLSDLTSRLFRDLSPVIATEKPDWILVQGDTTTVMAASMVAYYHRVRVGHVEAGLRTSDKYQPFPEEVNRRIASVVADLHFAPTESARANLVRENLPRDRILVTGNTVVDAMRWVADQPYDPASGPLYDVPWDKHVVLVTAHRRESFGEPLRRICSALRRLADRDDVHIVFPVHLNPRVSHPVHEILADCTGVTLLPPLDYQPMVHLLARCRMVLTDSGGLQEEAPGLGKPVLVLRRTTERPEGVQAGSARLVGTDEEVICRTVCELLDDIHAYQAMATAHNPYGDGKASRRIVEAILAETGVRSPAPRSPGRKSTQP